MIRSTSQMNSRIIAKIYSLKACFSSAFLRFIRLMKVQITKKTAEPMIVCSRKVGYLKDQAYLTSSRPKESQLSRRAGWVSTFSFSSSCFMASLRETPCSTLDLLSSARWQLPHSLSSAMLILLRTPSCSQRLASLKQKKAPWLMAKRTVAKRMKQERERIPTLSLLRVYLAISYWAFLQRKMFIIIWTKKRMDVYLYPLINIICTNTTNEKRNIPSYAKTKVIFCEQYDDYSFSLNFLEFCSSLCNCLYFGLDMTVFNEMTLP